MKTELERLHARIEEIEIAMMTTRRADGHLQSRAMATQKRAAGADLWFVTAERHRSCATRTRPARQPVLLQGPDAGMGVGLGRRDDQPRPREDP